MEEHEKIQSRPKVHEGYRQTTMKMIYFNNDKGNRGQLTKAKT